jgi:catalase (peroxidase I)
MQRHILLQFRLLSAFFLLLSAAVLSSSSSSAFSVSSQLVNYSALSADLASMFDEDAQYDDGSRAPLFVLLAWHSAASFSQRDGRGGTDGAHIWSVPPSQLLTLAS